MGYLFCKVVSKCIFHCSDHSSLDFGPSYFGAFCLGNLDKDCSSKQMELFQQSEWTFIYLHWEEAEFEPILIPRSPDNQGDASPWTKTHWVKSICRFVPSLVCWSLVWLLSNPHLLFWQHFSRSISPCQCFTHIVQRSIKLIARSYIILQ